MRLYRNDPLSRRLAITVLVLLNTIAIREEYLKTGDPGWMNIACFFLALLAIYFMRGKDQC